MPLLVLSRDSSAVGWSLPVGSVPGSRHWVAFIHRSTWEPEPFPPEGLSMGFI